MNYTFKDTFVYKNNRIKKQDFTFNFAYTDDLDNEFIKYLNNNNCYIFPAFCDVHVHLREPGFSYKETIKSGTLAAAHGGYSDVCTMPNLNPVADSLDSINMQLDIIERDATINVYPYAAISIGEKGEKPVDFKNLAKLCVAFSDDGKGIQDKNFMKNAMIEAKKLGKLIVAHCEDNSLINDGYVHNGKYAKQYNHKGISSESEWKPIERDIALAKETGCKYHVCHISTKESVELIRNAKADGVDISCETAPHYLVLNDMMIGDDGRFKMNPPIRSEEDRQALIGGIKDGTIDMISTDHAPHSMQEKSLGLKNSLMGVVGLETSFSVLYTFLVKQNIISLEKLIELMSINPRKRFSIPFNDDYCIFNLDKKFKINSENFLSMGKSTPFENLTVYGQNIMTICGGRIAWIHK